MKAELKQKWIEALRSGAFKQGDGTLKTKSGGETKYCCLGVLRECAHLPWQEHGTSSFTDYSPPDEYKAGGFLHSTEAQQLGLDECVAMNLAHRNDGSGQYHKHTFDELADLIEQRVLAE